MVLRKSQSIAEYSNYGLVFLALILTIWSSSSVEARMIICPDSSSNCSIRGYDEQYIYNMRCDHLGSLPQLPDACNHALLVLDLTFTSDSNHISSLQARALNGLRIRNLVLSGLDIEWVDVNAFTGLSVDLQSLALDNNILGSLPGGVFSSLFHLVRLQLQNNRLTSVTPGLLEGLTSLVYLDLSGNLIEMADSNSWLSVPQLTVLRLDGNKIPGTLNSTRFAGLSALEELSLNENALTEVTADVFSGLPLLERIYIGGNNITDLPDNLFVDNARLKQLNVSHNQITVLHRNVFNETKALERLLINDNLIESIPIYVFRDMYNLRYLDLQNNAISGFLSNSLSGLASLRHLNLSNNEISHLPLGIFDPLGLVETLSLGNNSIRTVEKNPFHSTRNVIHLDMSRNQLAQIKSDWFQTTGRLQTISLDHNAIKAVEMGAFENVPALTELDLGNNQLTNVDELFSKCASLENLNLAVNPLRAFPNASMTFQGMTSLRRLNLTSTCLTQLEFDSESSSLAAVEELIIEHNSISNVTASMLAGLTNLRKLRLTGNDVSKVERAALENLHKLEHLDLSGNRLTSDDELVSSLAVLSSNPVVDLSWNRLTNLESLPPLMGGIYVRGNPLKCSCNVSSWMTSQIDLVYDLDSVTCSPEVPGFMRETVTCYWQNCAVPPVGVACMSRDISALFAERPARIYCPWDPIPDDLDIDVQTIPNTPTSISVHWEIQDTSGNPFTKVKVTVSVYSGVGDGVEMGNPITVKSFTNDSDTSCLIPDMTSGGSYTVCVLGEREEDLANNHVTCSAIVLPVPTVPEIGLLTTANDSSINVTWSMDPNDLSKISSFRLSWTFINGSSSTLVGATWFDRTVVTFTVPDLTEDTLYTVCVQAVAIPDTFITNSTECQEVRTISVPVVTELEEGFWTKTMIIIIAAAAGGFLLLLLIVIIIIIICCCRRRKNEDEEKVKREVTLQPNESTRSTHSVNRGQLSRDTVVSMSVYDEMY